MVTVSRESALDRAIGRMRELCTCRMRMLRAEGAVAMRGLGAELATIHRGRLWRQRIDANGRIVYKGFAHFCEVELAMSHSSAFELIDLSIEFNEKEVATYGTTKLICLLRAPTAAAKAHVRRQIEAGATLREIRDTLRAARVKYGAVGKKRITGRKVVGGPLFQRVENEKSAKSTDGVATRLLAALAMAPGGKRAGEVVLTMTRGDVVFLRSILRSAA